MDTPSITASPTRQAATDTAVRHLATAVLQLRAAGADLESLDLDAASSALVLGLLEQGNRAIAYRQLQTVFVADANQIHRLDPQSATDIDALAAAPQALAEGTARVPVERMCSGMSPHRNTASWMQAHLHISATEARRRLNGSRLLVAPAPTPTPTPTQILAADTTAGTDTPDPMAPLFPVLAKAAADGTADVGTLASLAGGLEAMGPRLADRPDASKLSAVIEEDLAHEAQTREPKDSRKALTDWGTFLAENGAPLTDEQIIAKRGMFFRGHRDGFDEYLMRCDPIDSETLQAFGEAWTNPRSTKLPPTSASTTSSKSNSNGNGTAGEAGQAEDAGGSFLGAPAPEWAVAPGTDPADVPRSEWVGGVPATTVNGATTNHAGATATWSDTRDPRTGPQLLLDGVIAAIKGALNGTGVPESGGLRVRIGVLIGYQALLGQCEDAGITDHGLPISAANIRRLACNGDLLPVVLGGAGEILDLGREARSFSSAQRKAIAIRDRGCVVPGCRRPASTNEAHHVKPWLEGGLTSVNNGSSCCAHHHAMVHAGLITLKMINGVPFVIGQAGQPRGDPERNLYWHPELRTSGYTPPLFTD
ncbi:DUF222 domain-containing protein [Paeniglutamicibacter gangotriensis]|uniref:HNH endonuclease signature motif containing protein n=1 Tax=Paeniglutamicibacter gangotriensis TaxID=254787 RepID=UPI0037C70661